MKKILNINAHLKYVEFLLHTYDTASDNTTISDIKKSFKNKFNTSDPLLNQNFGIYRLLPLILMKEIYKNKKVKLVGDIEKIKNIRDAVAHNSFFINESGYFFENNKKILSFTYDEFNHFIHRVENEFYKENNN